MYYLEVNSSNSEIINYGVIAEGTSLEKFPNFYEIPESIYNKIKGVGDVVIFDSENNVVDIRNNQTDKEVYIVNELVDEEKIAMAEAIIDLESRLTELENKLQGGNV